MGRLLDTADPRALAALDGLLDALADEIAARVADRLAATPPAGAQAPEWMTSAQAAEHLGVHRDTIRKAAARGELDAEQSGPGAKLYFRRADLDAWRRGERSGAPLRALPSRFQSR